MSGNAEQADRINVSILKQNLVDNPNNNERAVFEVNKINEVLKNPDGYEVQVKSCKIDTQNIMEFSTDGTDKYQVGLQLLGGSSQSRQRSNLLSANIYNPHELVILVNTAFALAFIQIKNANPTYTGTIAPTISWNNGQFTLYYDKAFSTSPFQVNILFSSALNKRLNFPTEFIFTREYEIIKQESSLFEITKDGVLSYYVNSLGFPRDFTEIDEIIIQTSQIPVYNTFDDTQKDIRTSILKTIKYDYEEAIKGSIQVDYENPDYYSIDSHYPIKQLDIQLFVKYTDGTTTPLVYQYYDHFSCELEFKKKQIF